jgi:hypothetical protein
MDVGKHANALTALRPTAECMQAEEEDAGGVEDAFSRQARVVLRAGEAQVVVERLLKLLTCHFEDMVKVLRAHAHLGFEEEGVVYCCSI